MAKNLPEKQVAALPYRREGKVLEVLLITSRETRRWVIPKGWPMKGKKDWNAAAIEAFEEAGIKGEVGRKSIGIYHYVKRRSSGDLDCEVVVYPFEVEKVLDEWPEKNERRRKWFAAARAAELVDEEGLQAIIGAALA
ncbi:NUDIX hydrolase [Aestuariivirga litoralis]|uniref:NUDIX hydrolase n=1 Tax=Aestuariivirga litoralis TaxID=2650924 RepID=UPI0018C4C4C8|nr:NUDIX hydrolase [Aestuariivirga litoralis]MBG1232818.1 NUDIX hydrolase [Aestuariivirga litoralis]